MHFQYGLLPGFICATGFCSFLAKRAGPSTGTGMIWMTQIQHWNDLNGTNSVVPWIECAGAACWHLNTGMDVSFTCSVQAVSVCPSQRGWGTARNLVFVKSEDGFLLKWYEMTRQNAFVGEKITWEYWTSSCGCTFMRLLNYFKII